MKEYDDYSAKEQQQLAVCQRLISEKKVTCPRRRFAAIYKMRDLKVLVSLRFRACSSCWAQ